MATFKAADVSNYDRQSKIQEVDILVNRISNKLDVCKYAAEKLDTEEVGFMIVALRKALAEIGI